MQTRKAAKKTHTTWSNSVVATCGVALVIILLSIFFQVPHDPDAIATSSLQRDTIRPLHTAPRPRMNEQGEAELMHDDFDPNPSDQILMLTRRLHVALDNYKEKGSNNADDVVLELVESANKLGEAFIEATFYDEAIKIASQCLAVIEAELEPGHQAMVTPLKQLGRAAIALEKIHDAVRYYSHLETVANHNFGSTHPETLDAGMALVSIYMQTGNIHNAAVKCHQYREWLEQSILLTQQEKDVLIETHKGARSPGNEDRKLPEETTEAMRQLDDEIIEGLAALGDLHYILSSVWKRHMEHPESSQALDTSKWLSGGQRQATSGTDEEVEDEDWEVEDDVESEVEYELNNAAQDVAADVNPLDEWMINAEKPQVALYEHLVMASNYRETAMTMMEALGAKDYNVGNVDIRAKLAQSIQGLAHIRFQLGDMGDETVAMFERLLKIANSLAGKYQRTVLEKAAQTSITEIEKEQDLRTLSETKKMLNDYMDEVEDYEEEREVSTETAEIDGGFNLPLNKLHEYQRDVAIALNNLGSVHLARGEFVQAEDLFRKSIAVRSDSGATPAEIAMARGNLGKVLTQKGEYEAAELEFKDVLETVARTLGSTHETYLRVDEFYNQLKELQRQQK